MASSHSPQGDKSASVPWLGKKKPLNFGATFGLPWPRGACPSPHTSFVCRDNTGHTIPLQSWTTAFWPDGSVKWSSHAIASTAKVSQDYHVHAQAGAKQSETQAPPIPESAEPGFPRASVSSSGDFVFVDTGQITVTFARSGPRVLSKIVAENGSILGENGHLVLLSQPTTAGEDTPGGSAWNGFESRVDELVVEQSGPVRVVILLRGRHEAKPQSPGVDGQVSWIPFLLRFYLYAGSEAIRIVHTFVYDGDPQASFIRGLGIRFQVPLAGRELYNRHVHIAGVDDGVFSEAAQGLTGLWRDPGAEVRNLQRQGKPTPPISKWNPEFSQLLKWVPSWNDFSLTQLSPDGFDLKKRTKPGQSWVKIPGGTRAAGLAFLGSAHTGGLAVGLRHFWERYPTSLDIRNAAGDIGEITLWLYSPSAEPMDLRPYHDGLGQQTYDDQLEALKITYEDWEEGLGSPYGIARTNEIFVFGLSQPPSPAKTAELADYIRSPPVLVAAPEYIHETAALGQYWASFPHDISASSKGNSSSTIRDHLEFLFQFYHGQIEQRRWYGFWDHGDVMHTYDADRHTWRYDIGGYAWDNSELSPDLWLWLYFLCTGREDVFRVAEALTRHTGEVDAYHIGPYRGLGTRHGVQHWSDSCKQARVSNALYRRIFYFITGGDERTGELLEETLEAENAFLVLDPYRKVRIDRGLYRPNPEAISISLGTDWSALASSWFIEWERKGPQAAWAKKKLLKSMFGIARLKNGFVTGLALYNMHTGQVSPPSGDPENKGVTKVSHLSAMFGLVEICAELIQSFADELPIGFEDAWLDYCRYFNASAEEQIKKYGVSFGRLQLRQGHSRLTAYAASRLADSGLAQCAWQEFNSGDGFDTRVKWRTQLVPPSESLTRVEEAPWISTNITALYGLAAMQNIALLKGVE
ncbi:hypothetical protein CONLIGDRAFT_707105 [Coniochaeta ligniaria NRRL 30616]|uniref:Tat pathway signal sequence domain protein n=1 Tax=Coniochaeta ligniaria NRRL 30616 TaxID=1408157 RepID=A0A1J7IGU1_9PEZI|nr:hypothetical protein CONLIGDRAFT_707105 [Coniochaeta ligniaria NRRL 30616]